jgi:hypothetical protein
MRPETNNCKPSTPRQCPHGCIENVAPEHLHDAIGTMAIGQCVNLFAQTLAQVLARDIHDPIRSTR